MSASDHLQPQQFMSMDEAMNLTSRDYGGLVKDSIPQLRNSARYEALYGEMEAGGQREPIRVEGDSLYGGHHRVAVAHDLGWKRIGADVKYR